MLKFKLYAIIAAAALVSACQPLVVATANGSAGLQTQANTLTVTEAYTIKGSEKESLHAYSYLRVSSYCSRTVAISFHSLFAYPQTLIALRNRAMITGVNGFDLRPKFPPALVESLV